MGKESSTNKTVSNPKTHRQVKHSKEKVKHTTPSSSNACSSSDSSYSDSESSVISDSNYDFSFGFYYNYDIDRDSCLRELYSVICENRLRKNITCKIYWFELGIEQFIEFITTKLRNIGFDVKEQHCSSYEAKFIIYWGPVDHRDYEGRILEKTTHEYFSDFEKMDPFQLTEELNVDDPYSESYDDFEADIVEFCSEILNKCKERNAIHEVYMKCFFTIENECNFDKIVQILQKYGFDVKRKPFKEGSHFNVEFYVYWGPFDHSIHEGTFLQKQRDVYYHDFDAKYLWLSVKRAHDDDSQNGGCQFQYTSLNQKKDRDFLFECLLYESYSIEELFQFCDISIRSDKKLIESLAKEHLEFEGESQISTEYVQYVHEDLKKDKEFIKTIVDIYSNSEEVVGNAFKFADSSLKTDIAYVNELMDVDTVIYLSLPMNIREDDGIIKKAISEHPNLLNYVPQSIRNNYKELAMDSKKQLKLDGNYSKLDNLRFGKI